MKLTIATYGYFLYPVKDGKCLAYSAPSVDPKIEHACKMKVFGDVVGSTLDGITKKESSVQLRQCTIETGPPSAAATGNFDLVVDFASLVPGAKLLPGWAIDDPSLTDVQVSLSGGSLTAYADAHTNHKQWEWTNASGKVLRKALTSLTVYQPKTWSGKLTVVARQPGGSSGSVTFGSDTYVALVHGPVGSPEPVEVDKAHATSTITLCKPQSSWQIKFGTQRNIESDNPTITLPREVEDFLQMNSLTMLERAGITAKGRPNCGARQMAI